MYWNEITIKLHVTHVYIVVHVSITCLVLPGLTKIHDHLGGAGVQRVEVRSMVFIQTFGSEVVNTPKTVHKFPGTWTED